MGLSGAYIELMLRLAALLLLCAASAARAESPGWPGVALLAAAEASLAVDMLQTLDIKRHQLPHPGGTMASPAFETNPILGQHPNDAAVIGYFAGAALLTGATWYALPPRFRFLAPLVVLVLEVPQIKHNGQLGLSIRF